MTQPGVAPPAPPPTPDGPKAGRAIELLDALVAVSGGDRRAGQHVMADAVAAALAQGRHLVVEAPTGTGKTFALAVAAAAWLTDGDPDAAEPDATDGAADEPTAEDARPDAGARDGGPDDDRRPPRRVVVATATRALQDQLVHDDLPRVAEVAARLGMPFRFSVLKGRSNYLCLAAVDAAYGSVLGADRDDAERLADAASEVGSGERTELPDVDDETWRRLSSTADECPGARTCSHGEVCWAEQARRAAAASDVLVVNAALYAAHLLAGGVVLPPHQAVIVDEAHALPEVLVSAGSVQVTPMRLRVAERAARGHADRGDLRALTGAADGLATALGALEGEVDPSRGDLAVHLAAARRALVGAVRAVHDASQQAEGAERDELARSASSLAALAGDLAALGAGATAPADGEAPEVPDGTPAAPIDDRVAWVDRSVLRSAPIDATHLGTSLLWPGRTVIATSGTLRTADASGTPSFTRFLASLGAPDRVRTLTVDSPFDHPRQGVLYVPRGRMPSPKQPGWADAVVDELWELAVAADGRTLALFTSRAATERAAEALRARVEATGPADPGHSLEVLTQWDGTRQRLLDALRRRRRVVLCATRSFWTGIDIAGDACVVVAIDRLPFPRPDDPVAQARRRRAEARGERSFETVDLPAAATQLAQGVGRLIRTPQDRGVVAVLDTRLATAGWRRAILGALPPLRRSVDLDEVRAFLSEA